jgi:hypothetical protein
MGSKRPAVERIGTVEQVVKDGLGDRFIAELLAQGQDSDCR